MTQEMFEKKVNCNSRYNPHKFADHLVKNSEIDFLGHRPTENEFH